MGGYWELQQKVELPWEAKTFNISGTVKVKCIISKTGKLLSSQITEGLHSSCDNQALKLVETSRFIPAIKSGRPVAGFIELPVRFFPKQSISRTQIWVTSLIVSVVTYFIIN